MVGRDLSTDGTVVVGSVAFDTIETPVGRAEEVLGGAAIYFSVAASFFAPVRIVAVVGSDFPRDELARLGERGIDTSGIEVAPGRTFRWTGRYHEDMNRRDTLDLQLNVFAEFAPRVPVSHRDARTCFLPNIHPSLQASVLDQLRSPVFVGADTMNHWIEHTREDLVRLLARVRVLTLNDEEARLLASESNVVRAARRILDMGPEHVLIKRGEYGVIHFSADSVFAVPAFPLEEVFDPTGAGDTFAGGFVGSLVREGTITTESLRRAIVRGSILASFTVEDFGLRRLERLTQEELERRYAQFVALTEF